MDIQQWLAATADRAPPPPADDHHIPDAAWAYTHSQDREQRSGSSYRRRKRKRASSDSSIIAPRGPRPPNRSRAPVAPRSLPSERLRSVECTDRGSGESGYSSVHASESPEAAPQKTYERRPRHKTRPDRYEPKQRKQKGDVRKEKQSGKRRRKSHRNANGGRTAGLVESFQLKNGPKNRRLTMKPAATAGLFKHGRASAQVIGRCPGLPDLVFNEMRFLQRPADRQDAPLEAADQQHRSNKDRKRPNDGEISAYFGAKKPAHEQRGIDQDPHPDRERSGRGGRTTLEPPRRHRTPPIELPSKPFLGFGSEWGQPDGNEARSGHTSRLSWSETPPPKPPDIGRRRFVAPTIHVNEPSTKKPKNISPVSSRQRQPGDNKYGGEEQSEQQRGASQHGQCVQSRRGKEAALVELCQPRVDRAHGSIGARRSITKTTSQSLPRGFAEQQSEEQRQATYDTHDAYHTSDILKIHDNHATSNGLKSGGRVAAAQLQRGKEIQDPASSLSIDRLLDNARHVAEFNTVEATRAPPKQDHERQHYMDRGYISAPENPGTPLPVRGEANYPLREQPRPSPWPQRRKALAHAGHRTASVPEAQQPVQRFRRDGVARDHPPCDDAPTPRSRLPLLEDEEMLDDGQDFDPRMWRHQPVYASMQQAEDLAYGLRSNATPGMYEGQSEQLESEATSLWQRHERTPSNTLLGRSLSMGRTIGSEPVRGPASGEDDGAGEMTGFWKPNKLY